MTLAATATGGHSDHNPFRQGLQVTPQPTGALNSTPSPSSFHSASLPPVEHNSFEQSLASPSPPSASATGSSANTAHQTPPSSANMTTPAPPSQPQAQSTTSPHRRDILDDPAEDELPPAYTPNADVWRGETTVEYGPARPFQPPPPRPNPQNQHLRPNATGLSSSSSSSLGYSGRGASLLSQLANQLENLTMRAVSPHSSSSSSSYPLPSRPATAGSGYPGQQQHRIYAPPPGPPPPPPRPVQETATPPEGVTSEFARDFYAVGGDVTVDGSAPLEGRGPEGVGASAGGAGGGSVGPGKPTTTPTPGHPYLHDNMLLVYPKGFECDKCHNIGYKLPRLKPCKRCWPKYGKPFTGPLAYSFGDGTSSSENFQRPLPIPEPSSPSRPHNSYPGVVGASHHACLPARPPIANSYASSSSSYHPAAGPSWNQGPGLGLGGNPMWRSRTVLGRPPPGAIVYSAGDMRLGGKRCWRCDGDGMISFMLFDREQCPVCNGIGRTY